MSTAPPTTSTARSGSVRTPFACAPAPRYRTPITGYPLQAEPKNHFVNRQQNAHGNHVARLGFPAPATGLTITVRLVAEMTVINPSGFFVEEYAERSGFTYRPEPAQDLAPCLRPIENNPLLSARLGEHPELTAPGPPIVGHLVGLNRWIAGDELGMAARFVSGHLLQLAPDAVPG